VGLKIVKKAVKNGVVTNGTLRFVRTEKWGKMKRRLETIRHWRSRCVMLDVDGISGCL
jgi:hypothetical protein